jgi:hypothetical protein
VRTFEDYPAWQYDTKGNFTANQLIICTWQRMTMNGIMHRDYQATQVNGRSYGQFLFYQRGKDKTVYVASSTQ